MDLKGYVKIKSMKEKAKGMVALALLTGTLIGGTSCRTKDLEQSETSKVQTTSVSEPTLSDYGCGNNPSEKHDFSIVNKEATCTETGIVECTKCGEERIIPEKHNYGDWKLIDDSYAKENIAGVGAEYFCDDRIYNSDKLDCNNGDYTGRIYERTCNICGKVDKLDGSDIFHSPIGTNTTSDFDRTKIKSECEYCKEPIEKYGNETLWRLDMTMWP